MEHFRPEHVKSDLLYCEPDRSRTVICPIEKGDVTFHHGKTPHMTTASSSNRWRKAITTHMSVGGWDKLKDSDSLKAEWDAGKYIDLIRYKAGEQIAEDGHIFAERVMSGGQGAEFEARLKAGTWSLVMKRKLISDQPGDIALVLDQVYNFGFAIHDDYSSSRFHHVSLGYKLGFDNDQAEVNARKQ